MVGWEELLQDIVIMAASGRTIAEAYLAEGCQQPATAFSDHVKCCPGFAGKGFRMKEILLDLAEMTKQRVPLIDNSLLSWHVRMPGALENALRNESPGIRHRGSPMENATV